MANLKNRVTEARRLGREAFIADKSRAPALNAKCMILVNSVAPDESAAPILNAFLNGWDEANLNDERGSQHDQQMAGHPSRREEPRH